MSDINLEELLADLEIEDELLNIGDKLADRPGQDAWFRDGHMMEVVLNMAMSTNLQIDNEPGTHKHKAFINLIKLMQLECARDPWWSSRLGWLMWWMACYARYDSYYPLQWCFHYDPLNFYRVGEPWRPVELCTVPKGDPFNIRGNCVIHPEWYLTPPVDDTIKIDSTELMEVDNGNEILDNNKE
jgi:hypothetical protein